MQNIYLPGQKKNAVCSVCEDLVQATFQYGTYAHKDGTKVPHVLMLYCDVCKAQLAHAHQSCYLIQRARQTSRPKKTSVRVPQALLDMASSQVYSLGGDPKAVSALELVMKATVASLFEISASQRKRVIKELQSIKGGPYWNLCSERLVPLRLSEHAKEELNRLTGEVSLKNRSELVRASILLAAQDHSSVSQELRKMVMLG